MSDNTDNSGLITLFLVGLLLLGGIAVLSNGGNAAPNNDAPKLNQNQTLPNIQNQTKTENGNATKMTNPLIYGCDDVCPPWVDSRYGSYSAWSTAMDEYIATIKASNGTMINVSFWADNTTLSFYSGSNGQMGSGFVVWAGHTFASLLADLATKLHAQGMLLGLQPCFSSDSLARSMLSTSGSRASYIAELQQIITDTGADEINVLEEPYGGGYPTSGELTTYINFTVTAAAALKATKSDVQIMVQGAPWWDPHAYIESGVFSSLPAGTRLAQHLYYCYDGVLDRVNNPTFMVSYWDAVTEGDFTTAKSNLLSYLQFMGLTYCLAHNIPFWLEALGTCQGNPNDLRFLADACDICNTYGIEWLTSGNPPNPWAFSSSTSLNSYGQTMYDSIPAGASPPSPPSGGTMSLPSDNFNDTNIGAQWSSLINSGDSIAETNSRIENSSVSGSGVGLVSALSYDFTEADFQIDYNLNTAYSVVPFQICLTKVTDSNPYFEANWYRVYIDAYGDIFVQERVSGGSVSTVYSDTGASSSGTARITIADGTISFYLGESLAYSESYALSSYTAYLYVYTSAPPTATAYFDNFVNNNPPILGGELPISVVISYLMVMRNQ